MKKAKPTFTMIEIEPKIFLFEFESRDDLAMTFLRMQEHYESPHFSGKIFSLDQFKKWYKKYTGKDKFTYPDDWAGFNIPSYILKPFYGGKFKKITARERALMDALKKQRGKFYAIGCIKGSVGVLNHEITHARFYIHKQYQEEVMCAIKEYDAKEMYQLLSKHMYGFETWDDELNAYLVNGWNFLKKALKPASIKVFTKLSNDLKKINKRYFN